MGPTLVLLYEAMDKNQKGDTVDPVSTSHNIRSINIDDELRRTISNYNALLDGIAVRHRKQIEKNKIITISTQQK